MVLSGPGPVWMPATTFAGLAPGVSIRLEAGTISNYSISHLSQILAYMCLWCICLGVSAAVLLACVS